MKKEELLSIGLTEEQAEKVFAMNGADIKREQDKTKRAEEDLKAANLQIAQRDKDLDELKKTAGDAEANKKALEDLQAKYDKETKAYQQQLADRDYSDAVAAALAGENVKFTSKYAEKAIKDALMADRLALKNGALEGFGDRLKKLREEDPGAFEPDKPLPKFTSPIGLGGGTPAEKPVEKLTRGSQLAAQRFEALYGKPKGENQ